MNSRITTLSTLALTCALVSSAAAQDRSIPYRGHLEQNGIAQSGIFTMTFELFDVATGGAPLQTFAADVVVTSGEFAHELTPVTEATLAAPELYLQLSVAPQGQSPTLLPSRQRLRAVPFAGRAEPGKTFHVEQLEADEVRADAFRSGQATLDATGHLRTPAFRVVELLSDNQGAAPSFVSWGNAPGANGALCTVQRNDCVGFDLPFDSYNGTVILDISSTAFRTTTGTMYISLGLDPQPNGTSLNIGALTAFAGIANVHFALPSAHVTIQRSATDCTTPPCRHVLRIVPRSLPTATSVDVNDYIHVTMTELPF